MPPYIVPPEVTTVPQLTRGVATAHFAHWRDNLCGYHAGSPTMVALISAGITDVLGLYGLGQAQIEALRYPDAQVPPVLQPLNIAEEAHIHILRDLANYYSGQLNGRVNLTEVTQLMYDDFRLTSFDPDNPCDRFQEAANAAAPSAAAGAAGGGHHQLTPAEIFAWSIKRTKENYSDFKDDKQWNDTQ